MKKHYFHATDFDNLNSIVDKGIEPRNMEHLVYLCESAEDCLKFAMAYGKRAVLVCEVVLSESEVV